MAEINQRKSKEIKGRGGARTGAGRKAGSANLKTREIADRASRDGITPLEVMLFAMRATMAEAQVAIDEQVAAGVKQIAMPLGLLSDAAELAKDAAPYMHPRLASTEVKATVTTKTLAEELAELNAKRDAKGDSGLA
jgi:hypothetical protein